MPANKIHEAIISGFSFSPTPSQQKLFKMLATFLAEKEERQVLMVKGYAGTGKTSMVKTLVKALPNLNMKAVLMAPTGRAAKVLSNYTNKEAFTIHKKIYKLLKTANGSPYFVKSENKATNTIFIIDEASMISDDHIEFNKGKSLLEDLLNFCFEGKNCKVIFIGDVAQLPPVGSPISPALDPEYLKASFSLNISVVELTDVVRQKAESGILFNATNIRDSIIKDSNEIPSVNTQSFKDVYRMTGEKLEDGLNYAYNKFGTEDTVVICRSNKQANQFNQQIRRRIFWREEELNAGDHLMIVKNNYFWLPENSPAAFIANGDTVEVLRIKSFYEQHGHRFADVRLRLIDYKDQPDFDARIMLDVLTLDQPSLASAEMNKLYESVSEEYIDEKDKKSRSEKIKKDPFYNALQVKFAYAITCHKAQGGQWRNVFIEQGYLKEDMINTEYLRWLYTAFTRATDELYLVNFHSSFFN